MDSIGKGQRVCTSTCIDAPAFEFSNSPPQYSFLISNLIKSWTAIQVINKFQDIFECFVRLKSNLIKVFSMVEISNPNTSPLSCHLPNSNFVSDVNIARSIYNIQIHRKKSDYYKPKQYNSSSYNSFLHRHTIWFRTNQRNVPCLPTAVA